MMDRIQSGLVALLLIPIVAALVWIRVWLEDRFDQQAFRTVFGVIAFLVGVFLLGYFWKELSRLP
jgi:uncharacterized membrane protein YfcA